MDAVFSAEQEDLRAALRHMLADLAPVSHARSLAESGRRHDPLVWQRLNSEIGIAAIALPEQFGGYGGSPADLAVVSEELGRVLHGGPFFPTAVLAAGVLARCPRSDARDELLKGIAAGSTTVALAVVEEDGTWRESAVTTSAGVGTRITGTKHFVLDGVEADRLIVAARAPAGLGLYAVDPGASSVVRTPLSTLDQTRQMAAIRFENTAAVPLAEQGWPIVESALAAARVQLAAEQVGAAEACVELTAQYARTRRQFGRTIGSFQGVKHRLAQMAVRLELARSAASWSAFREPGDAAYRLGTAVAHCYGCESFLQTAKDTIQLHGGIGFTWEHDAHLFLRRARADFSLLGDPASVRRELAADFDGEFDGDPNAGSTREIPR